MNIRKLLLFGLFAGVCISYGVDLVRDGRPAAVIVTADRATRSTRLAVAELNHYLQKMTGVTLPVCGAGKLTGKEKNLVLVGESPLTRAMGFHNDSFAKQEYMIRSSADRLVIMGADDADFGTFDYDKIGTYCDKWSNGLWPGFGYYGWRDKKIGTVYAADDFLRKCGVRWYMPSDIGEVVPRKKNLTFADGELNIRRRPDMDTRLSGYNRVPMCFYVKPGQDVHSAKEISSRDKALFAMRHKEWGNGNIANHSFPGWKRTYKKSHPEYAALQKDGTRNYNQLCYNSQAVRKQIIADWQKMLDKNPRGEVSVGLSPDDYSCWCQCDLCRKFFKGPRTRKKFSSGYASNYVWNYVREMAETAEKMDRRLRPNCLVYWEYYEYPTLPDFRLPDNMSLTLCRTNLHRYGELYSPDGYTRENIEKWVAAVPPGRVIFWEYYNFPQWVAGNLFPSVLPRRIAADYQWKKKLKAGGVFLFFFCEQKFYKFVAMEHIDHYIARRFADDCSLDIEAVMNEYYRGFYGPAAEPMKKFWSRIEEIGEKGIEGSSLTSLGANAVSNPEVIWTRLCSPGKAEELRGYMNQALKAAQSEPYRTRVAMMDESTCQFIERLTKAYNREVKNVAIASISASRTPGLEYEDDRAWDTALPFRRFFNQTRTINESDFQARLLHDKDYLYVKIQIRQKGNLDSKTVRRDGAVWTDNCVEFFVKMGNSGIRQYIVNTRGTFLDCLDRNIGWNGKAQCRAFRKDGGWTCILKIPLQELFDGKDVKLSNARCNIVINQPALGNSWSSCLLNRDNFASERYASLLFMQ